MTRVVIDGVEYVPVSKSNPSAEQIARGIMESFWGEIPRGCDWKDQANDLRCRCSDSFPLNDEDPTVMQVVGHILARIKPESP